MMKTNRGDCTVGFKATYNGEPGFVTAGHCVAGGAGDTVGQRTSLDPVGIVVKETHNWLITPCDCAFIKMSNGRNMSDNVFDAGIPFAVGTVNEPCDFIMLSGGQTGIDVGFVVKVDLIQDFEDPLNHLVTRVVDSVRTTIPPMGGDSGGPFMNLVPFENRGIMIGGDDTNSWYNSIGALQASFPGISWGF